MHTEHLASVEVNHLSVLEQTAMENDARNVEAQAELSTAHRKQIDELRNFYSVSTINAKKVCVYMCAWSP
jgi:hypothetical protein